MLNFVSDTLPQNAIWLNDPSQYNYVVVLLSYILAFTGSYLAIQILKSANNMVEKLRYLAIGVGSIVLGTAIWAMHYVGMLSYNLSMVHSYDPGITAISGVIAIIFSGIVFSILLQPQKITSRHVLLSAPLLGSGIASMHYIGMEAMRMDAKIYYMPGLFGLSIIIAISASAAALWIMHHVRFISRYKKTAHILAATVLALAVGGMHYTGMAATVFVPFADCRFDLNQNHELLIQSILVTCIAVGFIIFATFGKIMAVRIISKDRVFSGHGFMLLQGFIIISIFVMIVILRIQEVNIDSSENRNAMSLIIFMFGLFSIIMLHLIRISYRYERTQWQRAKHEADEANILKTDFLANMSHELRTPLNSIIGMASLLNEQDLAKSHKELVETIEYSSKNLLEIVNDILDISKIESGNLTLEFIPFSPQDCIDDVINMLKPIASKKGLLLKLHQEKLSEGFALGDPVRFTRVATNIINNAIKYTEKGEVNVYLSTDYIEKNIALIQLKVTDTGIGIAKEKLATIFQKFVQADTSTTRKYGGSGLGLAITKQLVEMMDGEITVSSALGIGTTHIWRLIKRGLFPAPYRIGANRVAWLEQDIQRYIECKVAGIEWIGGSHE